MPDELEQEGLEEEQGQEYDDELRSVASTMVAQWEYQRDTEQLTVFFNNGNEQSYPCTPEQWEDAKGAASPGRWMHENVLSR